MIEDGILYKGNRKHLRHSNEQMEDENTYSWEFNAEGEGEGAEEEEEEEESYEETPSLDTHAPYITQRGHVVHLPRWMNAYET